MGQRRHVVAARHANIAAVTPNPQAGEKQDQRKNKIKGMSDMKKIKTKLVTFVTDNVRLVGIVETKIFLRACRKTRSRKAASREETKKVAMRLQ